MPRHDTAAELLGHFRISSEPELYTLGSFDRHVTVLSQQTRALNLAWALVETRTVPTRDDHRSVRIAIVGAGFAGLTLAAALRRKHARGDVTIFEERDALLPLQQGSDTRWLHPHIYDWPNEGSEAAAAMLPVLNWTAGRASDVVVQVLGEWSRIMSPPLPRDFKVSLFCNTRHLQISPCGSDARHAQVEWVGERRDFKDGALPKYSSTRGNSDRFDIVILAVDFGVETGDPSYWRNETFGQPSLNRPRATYLVSGQGDGAMIDLFRLRISQFRQDRILEEMFGDKPKLLSEHLAGRVFEAELDHFLLDLVVLRVLLGSHDAPRAIGQTDRSDGGGEGPSCGSPSILELRPTTPPLTSGDYSDQLDIGCIAAHGIFSCDDEGCAAVTVMGKPATAFLFELITRLQEMATVPMIDVRAYARWLEVDVVP
jgi:hypothetical protein